jgi:UrcA family protein
MKAFPIAIAAALGAVLAAQPAFAESASIQFKDLDLSTSAGQKQLDNRIDTAARKVCGFDKLTTGTRIPDKEARVCVAEAKQKIVKQVALLTEKNKQIAGS